MTILNKTKQLVILLIFSMLLFSCKSREVRENKQMGILLEQYEVIKNSSGSFVKDGFYKRWLENGTLVESGTYSDAKKNGKWQEWFKNGKIKSEMNYSKDSLDGLVKLWYENEVLNSEVNYKNGKKDGIFKYWYDNGNESTITKMENNKVSGDYKNYYKDKQIRNDITFNTGEKAGELLTYKHWTELGVLVIDTKFDVGNKNIDLIGKWKLENESFIQFNNDNTYITLSKSDEVLGKGEYEVTGVVDLKIIFDKKNTHNITKFMLDSLECFEKYNISVSNGWWGSKTVEKTRTSLRAAKLK